MCPPAGWRWANSNNFDKTAQNGAIVPGAGGRRVLVGTGKRDRVSGLDALPALPARDKTSAINASGSSSYGFAPKAVHHFP